MVGVVGIVCILGAGLPNPTIQNTLAVLWLMRWSTKLNLFLGVRHFNSQWLPDNMRYITSYLKAGKNSWFIIFSTIFAAYCTYLLFSFGQLAAEPASALSLFLVGWLAVLAVLEHCFLMMPMGETATLAMGGGQYSEIFLIMASAWPCFSLTSSCQQA